MSEPVLDRHEMSKDRRCSYIGTPASFKDYEFRKLFDVSPWERVQDMRVCHCEVTHKASGQSYRVTITDTDITNYGEGIYEQAIINGMRELYEYVPKEPAPIDGDKLRQASALNILTEYWRLRYKMIEQSRLDELERRDMESGMKFDDDKARWDLLNLPVLQGVAEVLTFGAQKYAADNWQKVENGKERYFAAMMRHYAAAMAGGHRDGESDLPHWAHMLCNAMFLAHFLKHGDAPPVEPVIERCPNCIDGIDYWFDTDGIRYEQAHQEGHEHHYERESVNNFQAFRFCPNCQRRFNEETS